MVNDCLVLGLAQLQYEDHRSIRTSKPSVRLSTRERAGERFSPRPAGKSKEERRNDLRLRGARWRHSTTVYVRSSLPNTTPLQLTARHVEAWNIVRCSV